MRNKTLTISKRKFLDNVYNEKSLLAKQNSITAPLIRINIKILQMHNVKIVRDSHKQSINISFEMLIKITISKSKVFR